MDNNTQIFKLYVGNLPYTTSQEQLQELFAQAGTVAEVAIITDRDTGRAKGFGFVTMSSKEEADKAIEMFNGYELDGRALTVNEARPREERPAGSYNRGGGNRNWNNNRGGNSYSDRMAA